MLDATVILTKFALPGELAQLVEYLHGMQRVSGSNPLFSTSVFINLALIFEKLPKIGNFK